MTTALRSGLDFTQSARKNIVSRPHDYMNYSDLYVDLEPVIGHSLFLKCEGMNFAGSIKMRAAAAMVQAAMKHPEFSDESILIESSSGNLGVALSAIAASLGIKFVCVTDSRCNGMAISTMRAFGTEVVVIDEPDPVGGLLLARINWVRNRLSEDDRYVWLNQYSNEANWQAHYHGTAPQIHAQFPDLDVLFVGVGTGGTAMGCARFFSDIGHSTRIVAIDPIGSASFGYPQQTRLIPGLGAGITPPLLDTTRFDDVIRVSEADTIRMCRTLARSGFLFGGSTGTVVYGAWSWLEKNDTNRTLTTVSISPDFGDRYLSTVFDDDWVCENYGSSALTEYKLPSPSFY